MTEPQIVISALRGGDYYFKYLEADAAELTKHRIEIRTAEVTHLLAPPYLFRLASATK